MLVAATLLGACGSGTDAADPPAAAPAPAPAAGAGGGPVSVTISAPDNGATVDLRGRRTTRLAIAGYAAPDTAGALTAGCRPTACARTVSADADGRWTARLRLTVGAGQRSLAISAAPADPASGGAANAVLVRLVRAGRTPASRRARRSPTPSPSRTTGPATTTVPSADAAPSNPTAAIPEPSRTSRPGRVLLVGDSLAEGIAPLLPAALPGRTVTVDAKTSRPLATGMQLARSAPRGSILALSLFTNDDPTGVGRLEAAVRESARIVGREGCAVWATIVRPPVGGVSYAAANARLEALAGDPGLSGTLRIVPWARQVAAHPAWLAGDGVHATPEGYRARAALYAQAIDRC